VPRMIRLSQHLYQATLGVLQASKSGTAEYFVWGYPVKGSPVRYILVSGIANTI